MVEDDLYPPAFRTVASLTLCLFLPRMDIVELVAGKALQRQVLLVKNSFVAPITVHLLVLALERELRFGMIIFGFGPGLLRMAVLALFTVALLVDVYLSMARGAVKFEFVFIDVSGMAEVAGDFPVLFLQGKLGLVMVIRGPFPFLVRMAILTFPAVPGLVNIIENMAGVAIRRNVLPALFRVAGGAGHLQVFFLQCELGLAVVVPALGPRRLLVAILALLSQ